MKKLNGHNQYLYISAVIIMLGILLTNNTTKDYLKTIGIVFIAIGGLLFIIGIKLKKKEDDRKRNNDRKTS